MEQEIHGRGVIDCKGGRHKDFKLHKYQQPVSKNIQDIILSENKPILEVVCPLEHPTKVSQSTPKVPLIPYPLKRVG